MSDPTAYEEGEILEDGEIADDDCDSGLPVPTSCSVSTKIPQAPVPTLTSPSKSPQKPHLGGARSVDSFEKENHENLNENYSENSFGSTSTEREDRDPGAKGRRPPRKRKRSQSREVNFNKKRNGTKLDPDITQLLEGSEFDSSRLPESKQLNFDNLDFDMFFDTFKVTVKRDFLRTLKDSERKDMMLRILKICKQRAHTANDFKRKFARLKKLAAQQSRVSKNKYKTPCKFFLEGKCHKGVHCTFSHECEIPKKEDICKFYIQGSCGKGENCNYMHEEFPCKFFHTGADCYRNTNCRFSHAPLDEKSRQILDNYLKNNSRDEWKNGPGDGRPNVPEHGLDTGHPASAGDAACEEDKHFGRHNEYDYEYEYPADEPFSNNPERPALLGPVPDRLRNSYRTWRWQQDCFEWKDDYKGNKHNLFNIENPFVVMSKPPPSDDEDEQEAMINYYSRQPLTEDDLDDIRCAREINEHQRATEREFEEERAMASAASLDFDLRKRTRDQPYVIPPVFGIDMSFLKKLQENGPLPELPQYAPPPPPPPQPCPSSMQGPAFGSPPLPHQSQSVSSAQPLPPPGGVPQFMPHGPMPPPQEPLFRDPRFLKDSWSPTHDPRNGVPPPEMLDPRMSDLRPDPRSVQDPRKNDHRLAGSTVMPMESQLQPSPSLNDPRLLSVDPRPADPRAPDPRLNDPRATDARLLDPRGSDPRLNDPRSVAPKVTDPRMIDPRLNDPRFVDPRLSDPRAVEPRSSDPRAAEPRIPDPRSSEFRANDPRSSDSRPNNARITETPINDPRVNRLIKNSPPQTVKRQASTEESSLTKRPFMKVHSQTLAPYRLKPTICSRIDYRSYEELFRTDSACKADPRLQHFFKSISSEKSKDDLTKESQSPESQCLDVEESIADSDDCPPATVRDTVSSQQSGSETSLETASDSPQLKSESEPSTTSEGIPNFSQILAQSVSSASTDSKSAEIPLYARGLLSQTAGPTFPSSSGLLTTLMSGASLPSLIPQFTPPEEKDKNAATPVEDDPDSDAEPDLVIASEYD